jgi:MFS transporter, PAT family, solute carrier family 33 (acetyl-CoA transportor), member 1
MLWAPLVDALYFKSIGRRKTWLVPTQLLIGILLVFSADFVPQLLGDEENKPNVIPLTILFFGFFFLCATQDIAVDGWALEILSKKRRAWASTCNSIGLTAGYTCSFQGFIFLQANDLCDFPTFMKFSGIAFLFTTCLLLFKRENLMDDVPESIWQSYQSSWEVCQLSTVKLLIFALLTRSVGFAATDTLTSRKLLSKGMKKEWIATIAGLLVPVSIVLPGILARYTTEKPLSFFMFMYIPKILLAVSSAMLVYMCPDLQSSPNDPPPFWFWIVVLALSLFASIASTAQFVSLMAFFAKVSDPVVGGSYMTTLNTATNMGSKWPNTVVLFAVNPLTIKSSSCNNDINSEECNIVDGYYVLTGISLFCGYVWIRYFRKRLDQLELEKESAWRVPRKNNV